MMTAHGSTQIVREAFKLGVEDFLEKPFEVDELLVLARRAVKSQRLQTEKQYLLSERDAEFNHYGIVGRSRAMQDVINRAELVAATKSTVLITGETGTGKEMVARLIHHRSAQREMPLIKVNCAAIPDTLLESELFGHVRGAFTGATMTKRGKFALADGGSIFLDEIGTMSTAVQAKLLRVLQEREFEPLGAERTQRVDVRVVAATNRDLKQMVSDGRFQEDLYYRLNVIPIEIPPLRDRRDDIPTLIDHFVEKHRQRSGKRIDRVDAGVVEALGRYDWPGNVRELENTIERAVVLATGHVLTDAVDLAARRDVRALVGSAVDAPASEPGMGRARDHSARARTGQRRQEGCGRADGHQPARPELLPGEVPHRLTTPREVSTPVADYRAGNRSGPAELNLRPFRANWRGESPGITLACSAHGSVYHVMIRRHPGHLILTRRAAASSPSRRLRAGAVGGSPAQSQEPRVIEVVAKRFVVRACRDRSDGRRAGHARRAIGGWRARHRDQEVQSQQRDPPRRGARHDRVHRHRGRALPHPLLGVLRGRS